MINLCLVVIATQFSETKRRETERMLAERARRRHLSSQSTSTIGSSGHVDVGGCYVEVVRYLEHLANRARRRLARVFRRLRRRYAAGQSSVAGDVGADRPRPLFAADASPRRRRRRRRHRDFDPRPSDAPVTADNSPCCRVEPPDSTPPTRGVVACRAVSEASQDCLSSPVSMPPRRAKPSTVANSECLQMSNTGLSHSINRKHIAVYF